MRDISVQNEKLYDALSLLTEVTLDIIRNTMDKNLAVTTESIWKKQGDDSYGRVQTQKPMWAIVLHKSKKEIEKTEEFKHLLKIISEDNIISSQIDTLVGTCMGSQRIEATQITSRLVYSFLTGHRVIDFDTAIFGAEYSQLENDLYAKELEFEKITPLCGFSMEETKVTLTENTALVKFTDEEVLDLFRFGVRLGYSMGNDDFIHGLHTFGIKTSYKLPKIIGEGKKVTDIEQANPFISNECEENVINALRFFKAGKLYPIQTITIRKNFFTDGARFNHGTPVKSFMKNKYQLLEKEAVKFRAFWGEITKIQIQKKHFMSVATRRFSQANERENIEDRIIDLLICAEAIFLSSDGNYQGELKYRLAHRAAMFIEAEPEKQKRVFNFMKSAYDVRSKIVHGGTPKLPKKEDDTFYSSLEEFCTDIEKYLRLSLKKAIAQAADNGAKTYKIDWESIIFGDVVKGDTADL